jgi:hypothetical protein
MHCRDQWNLVAADIEDGEFPNLISVRGGFAEAREIHKPASSDNRVPTRKR